MNQSSTRLGLAVSLLVFFASFSLLVTGSPLLVVTLSERVGLPLGNVITWLGMVALVLVIWFASPGIRAPRTRADRFYRGGWQTLLVMAVLWPFVSYALAGNWSYSFGQRDTFRGSSGAADWFFRYSFSVVLLPPLLAAVRFVHLRLRRR